MKHCSPWRRVSSCAVAGALFACSAARASAEESPTEPARAAPAPEPTEKDAPDKSERVTEAREHFQKAIDYYNDEDYRSALIEFQRAYDLEPTYRLFFNLAQVSYELRDYAAAERYFMRYLVEGEDELTAERRAEVENELKRLRGRVASVELLSNVPDAELFVDGRSVGFAPLPTPLRVSAGRRQLMARHPGFAPVTRAIDVVGGDDMRVELKFGLPLMAAKAPAPKTATAIDWPLWTGVASGALFAGGLTLGYLANHDAQSYHDALQRSTTRAELDSLDRRARGKALAADILFSAALAGAAATVVLYVLGRKEHEPRAVSAAPLELRGQF